MLTHFPLPLFTRPMAPTRLLRRDLLSMNKTCTVLFLAAVVGLLSGCVTHISTDVIQNPPPAEKFSNFTRFEMNRITLAQPYVGPDANEKALKKIQEDTDEKMTPVLAQWNAAVASGPTARTLLIEPVITEVKFINATARVWAGPIAGSSAVLLKAKITEKETGKTIAEPIFYSRGAAWGGTFTFGVTDNLMLLRIAERLSGYLIANYSQAVGGPTGADQPK